jgi:hypothetical protein
MFKIKTAIMALVVTSVVYATAASSASAAWFIAGEELAAGATAALATTIQVDESTTFNDPSLGVKFTCTGGTSKVLSAEKPFIQAPNRAAVESFTLQGCSEINPSSCTIETSVKSLPLVASVEKGSPIENRLHFSPKSGKAFGTIEFDGASCVIAGEKPILGQLNLNAPMVQDELAEQPLQELGTTENNSLEILGTKGYLEGGTMQLELASGKPYSETPVANHPDIDVTRNNGGTGSSEDRCGFKNNDESCELEVKVSNTGKATELEFVGDKFVPVKGENKFEMVAGAKSPECKKGKVIGGVGASCFVKITYNGSKNPGPKKYVWSYNVEALEKGGTNSAGAGVALEAEE